ncbi:MAG: division/cell wall cluster transcriptional repressor MraZ [Candidatus Rokubacteria bacterium]|nr:division/cell wall cluster transcriptional repressor MraZ [Candidatus Rokubacteria bacterium]MBI3825734.1 division/cell wall cluster transcriptional repressor MraZ [Candidatus Rokubacteria bacterium]
MFRGRYPHSIDPKGRVSVPAKFRDALARDYEGSLDLIVVPNDRALEVHPLREWEAIETKVRQSASLFDEMIRRTQRLYLSRAREVALDEAGRVLLSPEVRQDAMLVKDVLIIGEGTHFEIWDRQKFDEYERGEKHTLPTVFEKLASLGV